MDPNIETENMKQSAQASTGAATATRSMLISNANTQTAKFDIFVGSVMSQFMANISTAILKDPGLPRSNPTTSAWQVPVHPTMSSIQSAVLPEQTDFVVIGSGITGCSVTKTLLEHEAAKGSHVTVLEARTLVSGATGRNGGHLVTASGHTFGPLAQQHGLEAAQQITRFSVLNIQHVMDMVKAMDKEVQEDCQIRDVRKVMAVGDDETWAAARNSVLAFQKNVPECSAYHRIVDADEVPEVIKCSPEIPAMKLTLHRGGISREHQARWNTTQVPSGHTVS